jgi:hypothetical protein
VAGEQVEEAFLALVHLSPQIAQHIGDVPGSVAQGIVALRETIAVTRFGFGHEMAAKEGGGFL